jgi:hypothetical protein
MVRSAEVERPSRVAVACTWAQETSFGGTIVHDARPPEVVTLPLASPI